ncbi:hypothetical protein ACOMHN_052843 [Nucella lapillus]
MVIPRCSREIESDSDKMATCEEFDCEGSEIDDEVLLCAAAAATSVLLGCVRKAAARKSLGKGVAVGETSIWGVLAASTGAVL